MEGAHLVDTILFIDEIYIYIYISMGIGTTHRFEKIVRLRPFSWNPSMFVSHRFTFCLFLCLFGLLVVRFTMLI